MPQKVNDKKTIDTEVLVVGMGGSGTAAAMSAAETMYAANGKDPSKVSVLAIDKAGKYGGTSCITADTMGINAPVYQETYYGGKDYVDADEMMADWQDFTMGDAKQPLLDLFFNESGNTIDWLISHGFDYGEGTTEGQGWGFGGPQPGFTSRDKFCVKFQYTGQGYGNWKKETGEMFDSIIEDYVELGGEYMLEVEATDLIYDQATNTVTGVKAVGYDGTEYTINAKKVITATGGFSNNAELQKEYLSNEYYPLNGSWLMYGMTQNDGKIFQSALDIGAGTYNIGMPPMVHLQGAPVTLHEYPVEIVGDENDVGFWSKLPRRNSLNDFPNALAGATYGLQVNMKGERFSNEAGTFQTWKSGPRYYTIWSDDFFQSVKAGGLPVSFNDDLTCQGGIDAGKPIAEVYELIDLCVDRGIAYKADTLEELAKVLNMEPSVLSDNVKRYNAAVAGGEDKDFGKDAGNLTMKIGDKGPFYAFVGASYIYSTVGGLDVNTSLQVLGSDNATPINGLYAVGTDCLGVLFSEQREYVTYGGAAQGWAYTSGRLAGKAAVEALK
ncbi:MAG: FAD-binding protein [Oscillospiraceae bacterium]|nr:FAD-binding protein [Oscillospiraceae bacterium]